MMTDHNEYQLNVAVPEEDIVAIFFIETESYPEQLSLANKFARNENVGVAFDPSGLQLFVPFGTRLGDALPPLNGQTAQEVISSFTDYCGCLVYVDYIAGSTQQDLDPFDGKFYVVPDAELERRWQESSQDGWSELDSLFYGHS